MGSTVNDISRTVSSIYSAPFQAVGSAVGGSSGQDIKNSGSEYGNWIGSLGGTIKPDPQKPNTPGTPQDLSSLQSAQLNYANQFQKNLPQLQATMADNLTKQSNAQMNNQVRMTKEANQQRGLTYSGINQGQQQGVRNQSAQGLASAISGSNAGLQNASQTLNAQALQTGVGIQQTQQAIQNTIYQQQLSQMQANNAQTGSMIGTGLLLAKG